MKKSANLRELRESGDAELVSRIAKHEEELFGFRMKRFTNQLENTMKIRTTRREIGRIKTILANRKNGAEQQAAATTPKAEE